jgi:hypothetical protein
MRLVGGMLLASLTENYWITDEIYPDVHEIPEIRASYTPNAF